MKSLKKFIAVLLSVGTVLSLSGCTITIDIGSSNKQVEKEDSSEAESNSEKESSKKKDKASKKSNSGSGSSSEKENNSGEYSSKTDPLDGDASDPDAQNQTSSRDTPDSSEIEQNTQAVASVTDDWRDMVIEIDGTVYSFPYDYATLAAKGWTFRESDYPSYANESKLSAGASTYDTVHLYSAAYGTDVNSPSVVVGWKNYTSKEAPVTDCGIYSLSLSTVYNNALASSYPTLKMAGGITWGSSIQAIIAAYGKPTKIYRSVYYTEYRYEETEDKYMELYIYDNYGMMGFKIISK